MENILRQSLKKIQSNNFLGGAGILLGAAVIANFTSSASRAMISPIVPLVTSDFGVSNSDIGLALTGMWAVFAVVQLPSGILSDKFGEKRVIFSAMITLSIGCILLLFSPSFAFFFVSVWFIGIGSGLYLISATSLLTKSFDNVGGTLGVHNAGAAVGSAAIPPVITYVALTYSWRISLGIIVILPVLTILSFSRTKNNRTKNNAQNNSMSINDIYKLKENTGLIFTIGLAVCMYFVFQAIFSFLPTILVEHHNFAAGLASIAFSGIFVMRAIIAPVLGSISEKTGRDYVIGRTIFISIVGFLFLLTSGSNIYAVVGVILVGLGLSNSPVLTSRFMDKLTDDDRGTGFGVANTVANILGSTGSAVTGFVATAAGWPAAILLLIILFLVAIFGLLINHMFNFGW